MPFYRFLFVFSLPLLLTLYWLVFILVRNSKAKWFISFFGLSHFFRFITLYYLYLFIINLDLFFATDFYNVDAISSIINDFLLVRKIFIWKIIFKIFWFRIQNADLAVIFVDFAIEIYRQLLFFKICGGKMMVVVVFCCSANAVKSKLYLIFEVFPCQLAIHFIFLFILRMSWLL